MKIIVFIRGRLVFPLEEGCRAFIQSGTDTFRTSSVVRIFEQRPGYARFETRNTVYKVCLTPATGMLKLPELLSLCA